MFRITPAPTFKTTASLSLPGGEKAEIGLECRYMTPAEFDKYQAEHGEDLLFDVLEQILVGWSGVVDQNDREVPLTRAAIESLVGGHYVAGREIVVAWRMGLQGARAGN